ncbi:MAG: peptidylprolyl isomerase [Clostridia bacterium]|nr:peptidylprolyl isomerase [Clostridia bacterium]
MAKQKKNSNYVTEKTVAAKAERDAAKIKEEKDRKTKILAISIGSAVAAIALIVGLLFAFGAFEYKPEPTYHATFNFDNGSSLHIELYGNDAPETVKHFRKLCEDGHFDGRSANSLIDELLYFGKDVEGVEGIKGEFADNGVENKIPMKKGVLCMARGSEYNSAYGQFFVLTKNNSSLKGQYAAFGRITELDGLENLLDSITVSDDGKVTESPKITGVSLHAAH